MSEEQEFWKAIEGHFDEAIAFRAALSDETDRGCALWAAAYLDDALGTLLRARMVEDEGVADDLFRPDGPLGSFSARVDVTYMLGLIGSDARRDLHLIRKIRNTFGHSPKLVSFEDPVIAARCKETRYTNLETDARPRQRFTNTVMGLAAVIHVLLVRSQHLTPAKDHVLDAEMRKLSRELAAALSDALQTEGKRDASDPEKPKKQRSE